MQQLAGIKPLYENSALNELDPKTRNVAAKKALQKYGASGTASGKAKALSQFKNLMRLPSSLESKAKMFAGQIASSLGLGSDFGYKLGKVSDDSGELVIRFWVYKGNDITSPIYNLAVYSPNDQRFPEGYTEEAYLMSRGGQVTGSRKTQLPEDLSRKIVRFVKELQKELE